MFLCRHLEATVEPSATSQSNSWSPDEATTTARAVNAPTPQMAIPAPLTNSMAAVTRSCQSATELRSFKKSTCELEAFAPDEYLDPITMAIMEEPVTLLETKHTYDLRSIQEWFERGNLTDPLTNLKLTELTAETNVALKAEIAQWMRRMSKSTDHPHSFTQGHDAGQLLEEEDAKQRIYCFNKVNYCTAPSATEMYRHEMDVSYAYLRIKTLLGPRTADRLKLLQGNDGSWESPLPDRSTRYNKSMDRCYIAGRPGDFGNQGMKDLALLLEPRPNADGTLVFNRALQSLDVLLCKVGVPGATALAKALRPHLRLDGTWEYNQHLRALVLSRNLLGDSGVKALSDVLGPRSGRTVTEHQDEFIFCTAIETLDLSYNGIGNEGAAMLASAFAPRQNSTGAWVHSPMAELNLFGNTDITSEGLLDIISAMVEPRQDASGKWVYNPNMKKLVLDATHLNEDVADAIAAALIPRHNPDGTTSYNQVLSLLDIGSCNLDKMTTLGTIKQSVQNWRDNHNIRQKVKASRKALTDYRFTHSRLFSMQWLNLGF